MRSDISISFIIPTYNSQIYLSACLESIVNQKKSGVNVEILIIDNNSKDKTVKIARSYGAHVYIIAGSPPQVCVQRNAGFSKSKYAYVYFLDHDMQLSSDFLQRFALYAANNQHIDAWQVPENVIGSSTLMSRLKTFEKRAYEGTSIAAARIIKKSTIKKYKLTYDTELSSGPADWDMELQLKEHNCEIAILPIPVLHNEANMHVFASVKKRTGFREGVALYANKWKQRNETVYNAVIAGKQMNPWYRLFGVFFRKQYIIETLKHVHLYALFIVYKIAIGIGYLRKSV